MVFTPPPPPSQSAKATAARRSVAPQPMTNPPPRPFVIATMRSAVLDESSPLPPEFVLTVPGKPVLAVEVATTPNFRRVTRSTPDEPLTYFCSHFGLTESRLGRQGLRIAPINLQPGLGGANLERGPAGTYRLRYALPPTVWRALAASGGSNRLYYRAFAFNGYDPTTREPVGTVTYSWRSPTPDIPRPPFLFIRRARPSTVDSPPPAPRPSLGIAERPKLALRNGQLVEVGARISVDPTPKMLRGVNISQLQHRQFNWGTPYFGPTRPKVGSAQQAEPRPPDPSTHFYQSAGITQELIEQLRRYKCDIIRLPVMQEWVLDGVTPRPCENVAPRSAEEYLRDLDQVIAWIAGEGMYTLLCLHSLRKVPLTCARESDIYQGHLPDELSNVCWALLNERYRTTRVVLFDLFNEPHEIYLNDPYSSCYTGIVPTGSASAVRDGWVQLWHDRVRDLAEHLHSKEYGDPDRLLFVSGIFGSGWAASLRHMPVRTLVTPTTKSVQPGEPSEPELGDPLPNLVYAAHLYCDHCHSGHCGDDADYWLDIGAEEIGKQARTTSQPRSVAPPRLPVFVAEWGPAEAGVLADGSWASSTTIGGTPPNTPPRSQQQRVKDLARKLSGGPVGTRGQLIGWTAWGVGDKPFLDLRDERALAPHLDQQAKNCIADYWKAVVHCRTIPPATHPYLVTTTSAKGVTERVLTEWGELVKRVLSGAPP